MALPLDLTGKKFHMLTVIARAGTTRQGKALWRCACACGKETITIASPLTRGHVKSCGCARATAAVLRGKSQRSINYASVRCVKCNALQAHRFIDSQGKILERLTFHRLSHVMCEGCRSVMAADNGLAEARDISRIEISDRQRDLITGSILGDGCFECSPGGLNSNWCVSIVHGLKQTKYCEWKYSQFEKLGSKITPLEDRIRFRTKHHPVITELAKKFIKHGRKSVDRDSVMRMGPLAYAIWYLDDGNLLPHRISKKNVKRKPEVRFSTNAFTDSESHILRKALEHKFDVKTTRCTWSSAIKSEFNKTGDRKVYHGIRLYGDNAVKFLDAIRPYVDLEETEMAYKFNISERGPLDNKHTRKHRLS